MRLIALALTLGAGATFVARSVDVFTPHLRATLNDAHEHKGTSFVHIFQNCNIFNDGAFDSFREKNLRDDNTLGLKQGQPLVFGKQSDRGIRLNGSFRPEVVQLGNGITEDDLIVHDEQGPIGYLTMLAEMAHPDFPVPVGVFRRIAAPTFEVGMREQVKQVTAEQGRGDLAAALARGNTWTIE